MLEVERLGDRDRPVLALRGELDMDTAGTLKQAIAETCEDGARALMLDLRELSFMDSSGLSAVMHGLKHASDSGCDASVHREFSRPVRRLLELTGADGQLPLVGDESRPGSRQPGARVLQGGLRFHSAS